MRTHPVAGLLFVCLAASTSWAQPLGTAFTYQGRLKNAGSPANGSFNMDFKLYPVASGGTPLASQTLPGVSVSDGLFTVLVDFGAGVFNGNQRWLEVTVDGTPLVPRQALSAAPYAAFALNAALLDGLDSTAFLQAIPNPLFLSGSQPGGPIVRGINFASAANSTGVVGVSAASSGLTSGVLGQSNSPDGIGVTGIASSTSSTGTSYGGYFENNGNSGSAVYGVAVSGAGTSFGGRFEGNSNSPNGGGVYGKANSTSPGSTGSGVFGESSSTFGGYGVYGKSSCVPNFGGAGVYGEGPARGVQGHAFNSSSSHGGHFESYAESAGVGVYGAHANSKSVAVNWGGYFRSDSTAGRGVYGSAIATTGTTYGLMGEVNTASSGYAVYALGDMGATGVKPFRIDHPDDPANKYLLHYAAESSEVINFYSDTVTLDQRGEAMVELPHYFAKINTRPRYQLTAVGAPMPMLHVASEIDENALSAGAKAEPGEAGPICSFRIAGGKPGAKVSWEVKAVRNDRWVQKHGAPAEVDKHGVEKGTYQHPELFNQPPEKGMNFETQRARPESVLPSPPALSDAPSGSTAITATHR